MSGMTHIDELRKHLEDAQAQLSLEKEKILKLHPIQQEFNREEYAFSYVRAERLGMRAINRRLAEISWLPMQLDPRSELMSDDRVSMKRWLNSAIIRAPESGQFGNDFMHALTRCAIGRGWEHPEFIRLGSRIANLFRDLSCLIGLIYYCSWLTENRIEAVQLSDPENLESTAEEIAELIQSPEIFKFLRAQEQNDEKRKKKTSSLPQPPKKERPVLRVIENLNYFDPFTPETAPV